MEWACVPAVRWQFGCSIQVEWPQVKLRPSSCACTSPAVTPAAPPLQSGEHVKVVHGQHEGETGMVVRVENPVAYVFTDSSHQVGAGAAWAAGKRHASQMGWVGLAWLPIAAAIVLACRYCGSRFLHAMQAAHAAMPCCLCP